MKRYKPALDIIVEDPNGEWIKWEDVNKEIDEAYKKGLNCRTVDVSMMDIWYKQHRIKELECNCEEMYSEHIYWFCPAHGYKRQ